MIHRFCVGRLDCTVISDGQPEPPWEPALSQFFPPEAGVLEADLQAAVALEGSGRTTLTCGYNCLFVSTSEGLAVVDTGLGANFFGDGPQIGARVGKLGDGLAEAGLTTSDLAAVVFTHLHQDHIRGATWSGALTFGSATGHAHAAEVAFWSNIADPPAQTEHRESAIEAITLFGEKLRPFEYDAEILPGVVTVTASGHTPGHTAVLLESQGDRLLCVGDSFYDRLQLRHPDWRTPWDVDGERSVLSRRKLLAWAADDGLLVHAYHLPFPGLGTINRHGAAYEWIPVDLQSG
jgi:glyoxylase-like metal-dependent hydrolase (beta-lactamase superfamily II)